MQNLCSSTVFHFPSMVFEKGMPQPRKYVWRLSVCPAGTWFSFGGHKKGRGSGRTLGQIQHHPVWGHESGRAACRPPSPFPSVAWAREVPMRPIKTHTPHLTTHICISFLACVKKTKRNEKKRKLLSTILYTLVYTQDIPGVSYGSRSYDILHPTHPTTEVHGCAYIACWSSDDCGECIIMASRLSCLFVCLSVVLSIRLSVSQSAPHDILH